MKAPLVVGADISRGHILRNIRPGLVQTADLAALSAPAGEYSALKSTQHPPRPNQGPVIKHPISEVCRTRIRPRSLSRVPCFRRGNRNPE